MLSHKRRTTDGHRHSCWCDLKPLVCSGGIRPPCWLLTTPAAALQGSIPQGTGDPVTHVDKVAEWLQAPQLRESTDAVPSTAEVGLRMQGSTPTATTKSARAANQHAASRTPSAQAAAHSVGGSAHFGDALAAMPPADAARLVATGILQQQAASQQGPDALRAVQSSVKLSRTAKVDAALQQRRERISAGLRRSEQEQRRGALPDAVAARSYNEDDVSGGNGPAAPRAADVENRTLPTEGRSKAAGQRPVAAKRPVSMAGPAALAVWPLTCRQPQLPRPSKRQVRSAHAHCARLGCCGPQVFPVRCMRYLPARLPARLSDRQPACRKPRLRCSTSASPPQARPS